MFTLKKLFRPKTAFHCLFVCTMMLAFHAANAQQPILILQNGHHPNAITIRRDGQLAVTGGYDGLLKWWDHRTGLLMRTVVAHHGQVTTLEFSADGRQLLSGGEDGWIRIWDATTGEKSFEFHTIPGLIKHAIFSPRGDLIASCSFSPTTTPAASSAVYLWDRHTGRLINKLQGHSRQVNRLAFDRSGESLASISDDHTLRVWSISTGQTTTTIRANTSGKLVAFSPDGRTVAAALFFNNPLRSELSFFDTGSGAKRTGYAADGYWTGISISDNWRSFAVTTDDVFKVLNLSNYQVTSSGKLASGLSDAAMSSDGLTAAFSGATSPYFWPAPEEAGSTRPAPSLSFTTGLAFNRNKLVAWGSGNRIYLWDMARTSLFQVLKGHSDAVNEIAFSPDGRMMASCSNQEVKIWSAVDYTPQGNLTATRPANVSEYNWNGSQSVAFSPDGKYLATGELRVTSLKEDEFVETLGIRLWDLSTHTMRLFRIPRFAEATAPETADEDKDPPYWVHSIAFSPDGRTIAADNGSTRVLLIDVRSGQARVLKGHQRPINSVAFSPDGKYLLSASFDKTIIIWNAATGHPIHILKGHQGRVTSARFSLDGRTVVSGSVDRTVRLWDVKSGDNTAKFESNDEAVTFVGASFDGKTVFATGMDGKVNLWSVSDRKLKATVVAESDTSWVCFTPEGFYIGLNAEHYVGWRIGNAMHPANEYREQFFNPAELIAKVNESPITKEVVVTPQPVPTSAPTPVLRERGGDIRVRSANGTIRRVQLYKRSYAMLIGNSEYDNWNNLPGVLLDMVEVRDALKRQGFQVVKFNDQGKPVFDQPALSLTREEFKRQMEHFIDEYGQDEDNRLLIYYAGHGYTALLPDKRKMGYLVMRNAPRMPHVERPLQPLASQQLGSLYRSSINMDEIDTFARNIQARHVLFVFDSCFAGTVLFRGDDDQPPAYITDEVVEPVREFLTAGDESQEVLDDSVFRKAFVRGIDGAADASYGDNPADGYVLASELYQYVKQEVVKYTRNRQTPLFGKILIQELGRGDFVFVYGNEPPRK